MLNWQIIHGYLGHDPELKEYQKRDGSTGYVVNFSVAVSDRDEETDWFKCVMFGERAKVIEKWFQKGSQIAAVGRNKSEKYTGKDGIERLGWKLHVLDFDFCDSKGTPRGDQKTEAVEDGWKEQEEDIPF